jgi:hypothetical protein
LKSLKLEEQPHLSDAAPVISGEFHPNLSFKVVKLFSVTFVPLFRFCQPSKQKPLNALSRRPLNAIVRSLSLVIPSSPNPGRATKLAALCGDANRIFDYLAAPWLMPESGTLRIGP